MGLQLELRQVTTLQCQCPVCKRNLGGYQHEPTVFAEEKYHHCPSCGGPAPKVRTANGWFKWCGRVDKYLKS